MFSGDGSSPLVGAAVNDILVPSSGAWFGASIPGVSVNETTTGTPSAPDAGGLADWVTNVGSRPHIIGIYETNDWSGFSAGELEQFDPTSGDMTHAFPHMRWKPTTTGTWKDVADGNYDTRINTFAGHCANYPHKMFLTIYHEPEDNVNTTLNSGMTKADYINMWQQVRARFDAEGVTNVVWVMNYMGYSKWAEDSAGTGFEDLYPGDSYVDWIAWDPYITTTGRTGWSSIMNENLFPISGWGGFYDWAVTNHPNKPLMIGEHGVTVGSSYLTEAQQTSVVNSFLADYENYPQLKAVEYWHQCFLSTAWRDNQFANMSTRANRPCLTDWITMINSTHFNNDPDLAL